MNTQNEIGSQEKNEEDFSMQNAVENEENKERIPVVHQLILLATILLLLLGGTFTQKIIVFFKDSSDIIPATPLKYEEQINRNDVVNPEIKPFTDIEIVAKAAFVWDIQEQRVLYKKEASQQLPIASITKLMTALVAQEILDENLNVIVGNEAILQDGDSGLLTNETFKRQTLSDFVLMSSSNDGAYALAMAAGGLLQKDKPAYAFVNAMNIRAKELGLQNTYFRNPTGLDISPEEGGAYSSAKDISFLMEYIVLNQPDILTFTQKNTSRLYSQDGIFHETVNTNYYINRIPGLIGSKTGYTDIAGGNLVIAFDAGLNRPIIVTVLSSTPQDRFLDVLTLTEEAQKYLTLNN